MEQVVFGTRRVTVIAAALAFLGASLVLSGPATANPVSQAGIVVQHGDLGTLTDCVTFTVPAISGLELIERSRFEYRAARFPEGMGICWLDGEGCKTTRSDECFCTPAYGSAGSWSYWISERHDEPLIHHGSTYPSERMMHDGSVDYWTFGPHGTPPVTLHAIADICGDEGATTGAREPAAPVLFALERKACLEVVA